MESRTYIDFLNKWLRQQKGFQPLEVATGTNGLYLFQKQGNSLLLLKLMVVDGVTDVQVEERLNTDFNYLESLRQSNGLQFANMIVIHVGNDIGDRIFSVCNKRASAVSRCYLLPWVVDLTQQKLYTHQGLPFTKFGLVSDNSPLKMPWIDNGQTSSDLPDLREGQESIPAPLQRVFPWATYSVMGICIFLTVLNGFSTDATVLTSYGAKSNQLIVAGQYWRLVTSIFLHAGLLHLAFNMLTLYYIGPSVESFYGHLRYLVIFVLAGIMGNIASFALNPGISVGASGALLGLMGSYLYFWWRRPFIGRRFGRDLIIVIMFTLISGQVNPAIDNFAHLGGLLGGLLAAAMVGLPRDKVLLSIKILGAVLFVLLSLWGLNYGFQGFVHSVGSSGVL